MIENLWRMSIYGSVMILLVLAVRFLMRKYPKEYICALWMMVLVRLLIPIFIAGRGSLQPDLQVFNWPSVVRVLKLIYLAGMILTVAAFLVHQDMEMHCDESVMEEASTPERKTYSDILLKLSAKQSGLTGLYLGESHTCGYWMKIVNEFSDIRCRMNLEKLHLISGKILSWNWQTTMGMDV